MQKVKVKDKDFELFISENQIQKAIDDVVEKMQTDLKDKNPLFIAILNGAFMFASDLFKKYSGDCQISFVKYASYSGTQTTGQVITLIGSNEQVTGRTVVILEDIVDSGITMEQVVKDIKVFNPLDVKIATLLFKPDAFIKNYSIDYVGISIPNDFIVGYGLDYDGYGRNLKDIYKIVSS
ncbi:MAG: hypoxanthine phosphoribosyltransferase [Bacteroidetes bacterium]|nr:hypoxanthine phosphoribosyltransferase [Bacteroidota bacterium]HET6245745.1 phosphoribosyltransferase family protein [Bacteroidia bacterium]